MRLIQTLRMLTVGTLAVAVARAEPTRPTTFERLGEIRVVFPEADRGGEMELGAFSKKLTRLAALAESTPGGQGLQFSPAGGEEDLTIVVPEGDQPEPVFTLIGRAGLRLTVADGGVRLRVDPIKAALGEALIANLNAVVVPEISLEDTEVMAALGYLGRLYAKGDPDAEELTFLAGDNVGSGAGRVTLSLTNIPLGEALRYVVELGGVSLRYDRDASAVTVEPGKR